MKKIIIVIYSCLSAYLLIANVNEPNSFIIQRAQIKGNEACTWIQNTGIFNQNTTSGNLAGASGPAELIPIVLLPV